MYLKNLEQKTDEQLFLENWVKAHGFHFNERHREWCLKVNELTYIEICESFKECRKSHGYKSSYFNYRDKTPQEIIKHVLALYYTIMQKDLVEIVEK